MNAAHQAQGILRVRAHASVLLERVLLSGEPCAPDSDCRGDGVKKRSNSKSLLYASCLDFPRNFEVTQTLKTGISRGTSVCIVCLRCMSRLSASAAAPVVTHRPPCYSLWSRPRVTERRLHAGNMPVPFCDLCILIQRPPLDLFSRSGPILCVAMGGADPVRNSRAHGEVWAFGSGSRLARGGDVCVWRACGRWVECKPNGSLPSASGSNLRLEQTCVWNKSAFGTNLRRASSGGGAF